MPEFLECFRALPSDVRTLAQKNYQLWKVNPRHPSLHFKQVSRTQPIYSVRIGIGWRALALVEDDVATWFWIGSHADYDRLIKSI